MKIVSIFERTLNNISFDEWAKKLIEASKEYDPNSPLMKHHFETLKKEGFCKIRMTHMGEEFVTQYFLLDGTDKPREEIQKALRNKLYDPHTKPEKKEQEHGRSDQTNGTADPGSTE